MSRRERYLTTAALRRLRADELGATAIEFAFVAPLAILLTMGALEIGRAVSAQARINHAAKETARFASVRGEASGAAATQAELEALALQLADLPEAQTVAAASWDPDNSPGGSVTIQLQHAFTPVTIPFDASGFTFSSTATMMVIR